MIKSKNMNYIQMHIIVVYFCMKEDCSLVNPPAGGGVITPKNKFCRVMMTAQI